MGEMERLSWMTEGVVPKTDGRYCHYADHVGVVQNLTAERDDALDKQAEAESTITRLETALATERAKLAKADGVLIEAWNAYVDFFGPDANGCRELWELLNPWKEPDFTCPGCAALNRRLEQAREAWRHILPVNGNTGEKMVEDAWAAEWASKLDSALNESPPNGGEQQKEHKNE